MKSRVQPIKASAISPAILGTYDGECADANITNKNGLDITREVWENVFNSEEYKEAIQYGWYIGFLGHPEDPACQDFEHSCIVMTSGRIADNGKIYGSFNLVDTPVGRIVKALQDAGVKFGISVRGAGDIIANSVDPDTFVFRGFDLVAFPAYPDAIPTYTEIAASADPVRQKKYAIACATVKDNANKLYDKRTIDMIKQNFAPQSDEYRILEDRESVIETEDVDTDDTESREEILSRKVECMTNLYLNAMSDNRRMSKKLFATKAELEHNKSVSSRREKSLSRLMASQMRIVQKSNQVDLDRASKINLIYKQRVNDSKRVIASRDDVISALKRQLHETVVARDEADRRASNLDGKVHKLMDKISACEDIIAQYQDAYTHLYCHAIGTDPHSVKVTASTTVDELKDLISVDSATNMANMLVQPDMLEVIEDTPTSEDADDIVAL